MKLMKYLLEYLDDEGEESIEEINAYSEQQAWLFAQEICDISKVVSLECTVRSVAY